MQAHRPIAQRYCLNHTQLRKLLNLFTKQSIGRGGSWVKTFNIKTTENYFTIPSGFRPKPIFSCLNLGQRFLFICLFIFREGKKYILLLSSVFHQTHSVTDVRDQIPDYMDLGLIQLVFTSVSRQIKQPSTSIFIWQKRRSQINKRINQVHRPVLRVN